MCDVRIEAAELNDPVVKKCEAWRWQKKNDSLLRERTGTDVCAARDAVKPYKCIPMEALRS
ncbi:hypothetical protein KSC_092910 [Ktedonobacter sp. SOSP1-52]|nr:hypothetical protein KSC_092910 [Ktedonobacter sp. SOSP1-52]